MNKSRATNQKSVEKSSRFPFTREQKNDIFLHCRKWLVFLYYFELINYLPKWLLLNPWSIRLINLNITSIVCWFEWAAAKNIYKKSWKLSGVRFLLLRSKRENSKSAFRRPVPWRRLPWASVKIRISLPSKKK